MFDVSICECFSVLNVFIVCMHNTAVFKLIPLLCTHVYSYTFSTVHPPSQFIYNYHSVLPVRSLLPNVKGEHLTIFMPCLH